MNPRIMIGILGTCLALQSAAVLMGVVTSKRTPSHAEDLSSEQIIARECRAVRNNSDVYDYHHPLYVWCNALLESEDYP